MRTPEEKLATKLRKAAERLAHREKALKSHPPQVRYAKAQFKKGKKRQKQTKKPIQLGIQ